VFVLWGHANVLKILILSNVTHPHSVRKVSHICLHFSLRMYFCRICLLCFHFYCMCFFFSARGASQNTFPREVLLLGVSSVIFSVFSRPRDFSCPLFFMLNSHNSLSAGDTFIYTYRYVYLYVRKYDIFINIHIHIYIHM